MIYLRVKCSAKSFLASKYDDTEANGGWELYGPLPSNHQFKLEANRAQSKWLISEK